MQTKFLTIPGKHGALIDRLMEITDKPIAIIPGASYDIIVMDTSYEESEKIREETALGYMITFADVITIDTEEFEKELEELKNG